MTFHLIPWMWGVGGTRTVGLSDTIHVTEHGCESLFTLPEEFSVHPAPGTTVLPPPTLTTDQAR